MKGKITNWSKSQLIIGINLRMEALDTSAEEFSNRELLEDFEDLCKKSLSKTTYDKEGHTSDNKPTSVKTK